MSRIGKKQIDMPSGVKIKIEKDNTVLVEGPKGKLSYKVPDSINVVVKDQKITLERSSDEKTVRALHGLSRSLLANMVEGVTKYFEKALLIKGVGYRVKKTGNNLQLSIGFSHPVDVEPLPGTELDIDGPTRILVRGIDKTLVGQMAANIRAIRPPEPYKQKGIMYEGERLKKKAGKAGKVGK